MRGFASELADATTLVDVARCARRAVASALLVALACGGRTQNLEPQGNADGLPSSEAPGALPAGPDVSTDEGTAAAPVGTQPTGPNAPATVAPQTDTPPAAGPPAMPPQPEPGPMAGPSATPVDPEAPEPDEPVAPEAPRPVVMNCGEPGAPRVLAFEQAEVDALAGCEELPGLRVYGALDLRPLASLRRVVGEAGLDLEENANLEGLEGLEETTRLRVSGGSVPNLRALAGLRRLGALELWNSRLLELSGLENVVGLRELAIQDNPVLESLQGLAVDPEMADVTFERNLALRDVTSLREIEGAGFVLFRGNPVLARLPDFERLVRLQGMLLSQNAALEEAPQFPVLTAALDISIADHPLLERVTGFAALETARYLWISGNPNLVDIDLGGLRRSDSLLVILDNARLDGTALAATLAGVETERLRVPVDQTRAVLDPCPWATDEVCDEAFCAIGTDPACS